MSVDADTVRRAAKLARIAVDELDLVADFSGFECLVRAGNLFFQDFEGCQVIATLAASQRKPQAGITAAGAHFQHTTFRGAGA